MNSNAAAQTPPPSGSSRYENQKRRDWNTFTQYLTGLAEPGLGPILLSQCSAAHVLDFLGYLDQFGKTKVHSPGCPFFGLPSPPGPCQCPLRQAWGSLDSLVGRLRAAYEENGGPRETNPFAARQVRGFLREVRRAQAKARGVSYDKKRKQRIEEVTDPDGLAGPIVDPIAGDDAVTQLPSASWASGGARFGRVGEYRS